MSIRVIAMLGTVWERMWRGKDRARQRLLAAAGRAIEDEQRRSRAESRARFWTEMREGEREAAARCPSD